MNNEDESVLCRLRGNIGIDCGFGREGARKFRRLLQSGGLVATLGAYNGQQAVQFIKAGLSSIYVSGWQVAAANNGAHEIYPDQGLYPVNSVPTVISEIVRSLRRADQIQSVANTTPIKDYWVPIIADGEAGFGGPLHAYELTRQMIEAGAAAVHFEDQVSHEKKCGHLGGKVLVPVSQMIRTLRAARLASRVLATETVIIARTDAESAPFLLSDIDPQDAEFIDRSVARTAEGYFRFRPGFTACVERALAYAPYADMLWFETSTPSFTQASHFAQIIHSRFPGKWLAYNCSPSFHWSHYMSPADLQTFQQRLRGIGYVFQFITLGSYHACNLASFQLASGYLTHGMGAYSTLQETELALPGYTGGHHQTEAGVPYFDLISQTIGSSTEAMAASTETTQFSTTTPQPT